MVKIQPLSVFRKKATYLFGIISIFVVEKPQLNPIRGRLVRKRYDYIYKFALRGIHLFNKALLQFSQ